MLTRQISQGSPIAASIAGSHHTQHVTAYPIAVHFLGVTVQLTELLPFADIQEALSSKERPYLQVKFTKLQVLRELIKEVEHKGLNSYIASLWVEYELTVLRATQIVFSIEDSELLRFCEAYVTEQKKYAKNCRK